ncbi:MAG: hypothetical protein V1729_02490 [Candidatus Woesearchaeota archaeon]
MNDISKIQQVNTIARELIRHGQARSMEEATRLALKQVEESGHHEMHRPAPPVSLRSPDSSAHAAERFSHHEQESSQVVEYAPAGDVAAQASAMAIQDMLQSIEKQEEERSSPEPEAVEQEFEYAAETSTDVQQADEVPDCDHSDILSRVDAHSVRIDDLNGKLISLIAEIAGLKEEVRNLRENPVVAPPLKPKMTREGQTQFRPEPTPVKPAEGRPKGDGHARTGNFNSADVSIEKFFYYGHK